MKMNLK
jgi:hypothetical protein